MPTRNGKITGRKRNSSMRRVTKEAQNESLTNEIKDVPPKITDLDNACQMLHKESWECMATAEKKNDMNLVINGNSLKRASDDKRREMKKLEEALCVLKEKRKKI